MDETDKFRATTLQVAGFALMTPIGNLVINYLEIKNAGLLNSQSFYYLWFTVFLLLIGLLCIVIGDIIHRKRCE